jgi:hypothetical protein
MKKRLTTIAGVAAVLPLLLTVSNAAVLNCEGSIIPAGVCNIFAGAFTDFSFGAIIRYILYIIIAVLIIFIILQIVKAVFSWVGHSNDDKARQGAIKSITNAVVAGIVLIVSLVVIVLVTGALGLNRIPNPAYGCYDPAGFSYIGTNGDTAPNNAKEVSNSVVVEGAPVNASLNQSTNASLKANYTCISNTNNNELTTSYVIAKRISVNQAK